jgi:hypothetical protein
LRTSRAVIPVREYTSKPRSGLAASLARRGIRPCLCLSAFALAPEPCSQERTTGRGLRCGCGRRCDLAVHISWQLRQSTHEILDFGHRRREVTRNRCGGREVWTDIPSSLTSIIAILGFSAWPCSSKISRNAGADIVKFYHRFSP